MVSITMFCHWSPISIRTCYYYLESLILECTFSSAGSVNGGNSAELAKEEDIDGFLVGGASLKVLSCQSWLSIHVLFYWVSLLYFTSKQ